MSYSLTKKLAFLTLALTGPYFCHGADPAQKQLGSAEQTVISVAEYQELIAPIEYQKWSNIGLTLVSQPDYRSEIENTGFCQLEKMGCALSKTERSAQWTRKIEHASINSEVVNDYLENMAKRVNRDPIEPKFRIEDGRVAEFSQSQSGLTLEIEDSLKKIAAVIEAGNGNLPSKIDLPYKTIKPTIQNNSAETLGISHLIGEGHSNFKGSPKNRIFNINLATEKFNGVLIKPGEEFSFVSVLGPVDGEHGYLPELVIKKDKTEPEFGGGICQVSTTTFRAAINSGLEITARRNHAYPVRYYNPQGMDATVYVPKPDLRFINNTPGHILIQTKVDGTELVFQFWGTPDGRKIEIDGPHIISRGEAGAMKTAFTQKVFNADGSLRFEDVFNSSYDSPDKYPHPGEENVLTKKPDGWSEREWKRYKKAHGI